jgi:hypothetical protein
MREENDSRQHSVNATACSISCKATRIRAVGDPTDMLVDAQYQKNVGYLVAEFWDDQFQRYDAEPVGTVFFVEQTLGDGFGCVHYAVTCRHVLEGISHNSTCRDIFLRINNLHGLAEDIPLRLADWVLSTHTDVAVARINLPPKFPFWACSMERSLDFSLLPGHGVFFVGLFSSLPGFKSVQAIVRSGTIARLSTRVPIKLNALVEVDAHLVELRSWGGESGSPVFVYDEHVRIPYIGDSTSASLRRNDLRASDVMPSLLGILHGHFEIPAAVKREDVEIGGLAVNSGIGVVIPASEIKMTLMDERLVEDRNRELQDRVARQVKLPKPDAG